MDGSAQQHGYRGRVRSGCLTCRSRKVRCDERRPACHNCARLKRTCVYKPTRATRQNSAPSPLDAASASQMHPDSSPGRGNGPIWGSEVSLETTTASASSRIEQDASLPLSADISSADVRERLMKALRRHDNAAHVGTDKPGLETMPLSTLISRDIELTTTMDILAASDVPLQLSSSLFVDAVECPAITPYDGANWHQAKLSVAELGESHAAISSAIAALSMQYKAQVYNVPSSKAWALYQASKIEYGKSLADPHQDFGIILVSAFLLCLFEYIHYETREPVLRPPSPCFLMRLRTWSQQESRHAPLELRISTWLRLLYVATLRGGGMGIVSDAVYGLLPGLLAGGTPGFQLLPEAHPDISVRLSDMLTAPMFDFYARLQGLSGTIAKLSHYHRSRTTSADQEDVVRKTTQIKAELGALWDARATLQRQTPADLRSHLAARIAEPVIALAGICEAAYHAEFVDIGRLLGDPVSDLPDSQAARRRIREIIDGDWNAIDRDTGRLNPGYLRPLFLYAIECMQRDEIQWAVARLRQIQSPLARSDFFASFAEVLGDMQLRKERRCTTKYSCIWYFGVPPPFL
ncbi:hypothetical protein GE09DRAFT_1261826 [Coniochaeta sp. 2T2.1]|nr:hypothetical protein GE09DRAFT_1261826 [Coniochaeta sp. 2T2.1]